MCDFVATRKDSFKRHIEFIHQKKKYKYVDITSNRYWKQSYTDSTISISIICGICHNREAEIVLYTLCFVNNQIIVAQDQEELTRKLIEEYRNCGIEVNIKKLKSYAMEIYHRRSSQRMEDEINHWQEYKYLGMKLKSGIKQYQSIYNTIITIWE